MSRLIGLVRAGLVAREPNPEDGRSAHAVVTAAGRQRLKAAAPTYLAGIQEHFTAHLSGRQNANVATALESVLRAAKADPPR